MCTARFKLQKLYILSTQRIYAFYMDFSKIISMLVLTGFYNREGVCLLRGTDWIFKYNSG